MKILIISYFFPPLNSVASLRPYSFAKAYSNLGHDVTVLTGSKPKNGKELDLSCENFEVLEVQSGPLNMLFSLLSVNSGDVRQDPTTLVSKLWRRIDQFRVRRGIMILGRLPDALDLLIGPSKKAIANENWDLVISTYAPRYCHAIARKLKVAGKTRFWVADFRDLWTQHHQFKGLFPFTLVEKRLERSYAKDADLITTVSESLAAQFSSNHPNTNCLVVPNGFDPEDTMSLPSEPLYRDARLRLIYTGTTYSRWGSFRNFLEAVRQLAKSTPNLEDNLEVIFAGNDIGKLSQRSTDMGLAQIVKFIGFQKREDVLRMQRDATILLFFDPNKGTGIATGKIYEYLASGSHSWRIGPSHKTVATELFSSTGAGSDIGNDPKEIADQIRLLIQNPSPIHNTRNLSEISKFRRDSIASALMAKIEKDLLPMNQAELSRPTQQVPK